MDRPPVSLAICRTAATTSVFTLILNLLELTMRTVRPDIYWDQPKDLTSLGRSFQQNYDFIIVGAGSAGSVIASRLSEVGEWNVLLLEAGGSQAQIADIPTTFVHLQRGPSVWERLAEPNSNFCQAMEEKRCYLHSGKVLGGTSAINAMLYVRGNRRDYDNWAALGNTGWDYNTVLEYFKKSEDMRVDRLKKDTLHHSTGGYLTIEEFQYQTPLSHVLLEAGQELGYKSIDYNGQTQCGFTRTYTTVRDGYRCSTAKGFLQPAKERTNLDISLDSEAERILIDENTKQAHGVVFRKQGKRYTIYAKKEVIVTAGAMESPKLLMLSGVGPKEHLKDVGISPIISDLAVGNNLQDHIVLGGLLYLINKPLGISLPGVFTLPNMIDFLVNKRGPFMTTGLAETCAFVNSKYSDDPEYPDIGVFFSGAPENADGSPSNRLSSITEQFYNAVYEPILYKDSYTPLAALMHPKSRGVVRLRGKDQTLLPAVYPNYLSEQQDVDILVEAAKFGLLVSKTRTMQKYGATVNPNPYPGCQDLRFLSDEYLECAVRQYTVSLGHYSGTCKMGPDGDPDAVVDPRLRVRGVTGLRVADASIMPVIPTANTNAPTIMIAEKASDMIKEDWGILNSGGHFNAGDH